MENRREEIIIIEYHNSNNNRIQKLIHTISIDSNVNQQPIIIKINTLNGILDLI
jgi:hypothetical protein